MKNLYAPWRTRYIKDAKDKNSTACPFCVAFESDSEKDRENLILKRTEHAVVMLNRFPYNTGHLLVLPVSHTPNLVDLDQVVRSEIMELISQATDIVQKVLKCDGSNIGFNIGESCGGSVPTHVHGHVLPRWSGDTGFLPLLSDTKVISVDLAEVYDELKPYF